MTIGCSGAWFVHGLSSKGMFDAQFAKNCDMEHTAQNEPKLKQILYISI